MFKRSDKSPITVLNQAEILTILGEDLECVGNIKSNSNVRIEGKITGDILVKKGVILGEKGLIKGNLETETAVIFGVVNGNVKVKHLEIKQTGFISGDVKTENIVIDLGGKYNGKLDMKNGNEKQLGKAPEKEEEKAVQTVKSDNSILNDISF
jgi:cytoskeletal protein CcmA (bactofilin family)